uniref:Mitochondrial import inner membrane translocase subunit TIM22 n=1 Tax=Sexangularia sp. CB-2014 TaxID=1486929 RepID=A0A7S1VCM2_9EUKA|mmetsp:Transcript_16285/g.50982  ORF Transcript_16285/g.50982 Transcript_16285/m.50982 type:complete len:149 (+) Transcript_16285:172-618(+)
MQREPCPDRLWSDAGGAFSMGFLGGSVWHGVIGYRNYPADPNQRFSRMFAGLRSARLRAPRTGAGFGAWGFLFSTFDCALVHYRRKEDWKNPIAAGFLTGFTIAARGGLKRSVSSGIVGGLLLGLFEAVGFMLGKMVPSPEAPHGQAG